MSGGSTGFESRCSTRVICSWCMFVYAPPSGLFGSILYRVSRVGIPLCGLLINLYLTLNEIMHAYLRQSLVWDIMSR